MYFLLLLFVDIFHVLPRTRFLKIGFEFGAQILIYKISEDLFTINETNQAEAILDLFCTLDIISSHLFIVNRK